MTEAKESILVRLQSIWRGYQERIKFKATRDEYIQELEFKANLEILKQ